jgi:predicted DNA-binding protein
MPTSKERINISVDPGLFAALKKLSAMRKKAVSTLARELVEKALELEEDLHFSSIADRRLKGKSRVISHNEAWK